MSSEKLLLSKSLLIGCFYGNYERCLVTPQIKISKKNYSSRNTDKEYIKNIIFPEIFEEGFDNGEVFIEVLTDLGIIEDVYILLNGRNKASEEDKSDRTEEIQNKLAEELEE